MTKYEAKIKNGPVEILTEEQIGEFFHFFSKEEIEYVNELVNE
jgi:hypothetical protein